MPSLIVTVRFLLKVVIIFRPLCTASDAAFVPRARKTLRVKAFASFPEMVVAPRKLVWIAMTGYYYEFDFGAGGWD